MNDLDNPNPLLLEILHNAVPPGVAEDIPFDVPGFVVDDFFPAPVVDDIIANWNNAPPPPNVQKDTFLMYKDPWIEQRFLEWEANKSRKHLGFSALLLFCCFVAHLSVCQQGSEEHWTCGDRTTFILATLLIWTPLIAPLLPAPLNWQYKELICSLHQILFGVMVSSFLHLNFQQSANDTCAVIWSPEFIKFCTVPVLVESVLFKVRLKYHYPLNAILISLVASPWFLSGIHNLPASDYVVSLAATVIMPTCFILLYQTQMRKRFEQTL